MVEVILDGRQPVSMTLAVLMRAVCGGAEGAAAADGLSKGISVDRYRPYDNIGA